MKKIWILLLILFTLQSPALAEGAEQLVCNGKPVLGSIEKIMLMDDSLSLDAKLDTGAEMSSLSATDITIYQHHHKAWVRFTFYSQQTKSKIIFTKPLIKYVHILKRQEENLNQQTINKEKYAKRPVVSFLVCIGSQQKKILVNLVDRLQFHYPFLLGRNALKKFHLVVDVSREYLTTLKCQTVGNATTSPEKE